MSLGHGNLRHGWKSHNKILTEIAQHHNSFKGRFLGFRRYHNFANLFSKLLESTFYKEISKFQ